MINLEAAKNFEIGISHFANEEYELAFPYFKLAANQGAVEAQDILSWMYNTGLQPLPTWEETPCSFSTYDKVERQKTLQMAEQGDKVAQFKMGRYYEYKKSSKGWGSFWLFSDDEELEVEGWIKAQEWYQLAADQAYPPAQYRLALLAFDYGNPEESRIEAAKWYQRAAASGHAQAQYQLGYMFMHGLGKKDDKAKALIWYRAAAAQAHRDAQYQVGCFYRKGLGTENDKIYLEELQKKGVGGEEKGAFGGKRERFLLPYKSLKL